MMHFIISIFLLQACSKTNTVIIVEAENYVSQEQDEIRTWEVIDKDYAKANPDKYPALTKASKGAYLKILPDTRVTHDDELVVGESFSNEPGVLGVLNYKIDIPKSGRYYVWVRAFSEGTEDNGIHVGIDGTWPESGQRLQWCDGKHEWYWESKQRTIKVHCGVEKLIYIDIDKPGEHLVSFSMREDGFQFDQWALTSEYIKPF